MCVQVGCDRSLVGLSTVNAADLIRQERRRLPDGSCWQLHFEAELSAPTNVSPRLALQRYIAAADLLRDRSNRSSFRRGELFRDNFAFVLGDVDGGARAVHSLLAAMSEACQAQGTDHHGCKDLDAGEGMDADWSGSFLTSVMT